MLCVIYLHYHPHISIDSAFGRKNNNNKWLYLSEKERRTKFDRGIKPNARPVIMLVPFGPVDFVIIYGDRQLHIAVPL